MFYKITILCIFAFYCQNSISQTLCSLSKIQRDNEPDRARVEFNGLKELDISVDEDDSTTFHRVKDGVLSTNGKPGDKISLKMGKKMHASQPNGRSCVLVHEEREGRAGIYVEEQQHVSGKPPYLKSEFVEIE